MEQKDVFCTLNAVRMSDKVRLHPQISNALRAVLSETHLNHSEDLKNWVKKLRWLSCSWRYISKLPQMSWVELRMRWISANEL